MDKTYYVYILANKCNGTIYVGVTSDLIKRVWEHKNSVCAGFTKKYKIDKLVYYEEYEEVNMAINREKRLKKYTRKWKLSLIEENNPKWDDLYDEII